MITGAVGAEVLEDASQGRIWHRNLQEIIAQWDLSRISNYVSAELGRELTMLSFAPDSPRNDIGSSETPSYMTPWGNMDWLVIPNMNVRNDM